MKDRCKEHRKNPTLYEEEFKKRLLCNHIGFRSQVQIGYYIVDFITIDTGIVVEIDGQQHDENIEYDNNRTKFLKSFGLRIVRIRNKDIHNFDLDILRATKIFNRKMLKEVCTKSKKEKEFILNKINKVEEHQQKSKKIKITEDGQPCRKCGEPVKKIIRTKEPKLKNGQEYYFRAFCKCENCGKIYMIDSEKVYVKNI